MTNETRPINAQSLDLTHKPVAWKWRPHERKGAEDEWFLTLEEPTAEDFTYGEFIPLYAALAPGNGAVWPADTIEGREAIASYIYDAFPFDGPAHKTKPAWIPHGNSQWQNKARETADTIINLMRPDDAVLPCDVHLPPNTFIGKGCNISTVLASIKLRETFPEEATRFSELAPSPAALDSVSVERCAKICEETAAGFAHHGHFISEEASIACAEDIRRRTLIGQPASNGKPVAWGRVIDGKAITVSLQRTGSNDEPLYAGPSVSSTDKVQP
jgi:hypothetical protein